MDEQAKRFQERNEDYRKIWKLSPMDVEAQARWYDYSRARDAMFECTDTPECPWYVVPSNDQRKARLNCISHFLSLIPYEEVPREPIKFPKRQKQGDYVEPNYPYQGCPPEILRGRNKPWQTQLIIKKSGSPCLPSRLQRSWRWTRPRG